VLLTSSLDKIARLWTDSDQGFGYKSFYLCGVIDPNKYMFGSAPSSFAEQNSTPYIHWLTGRAMSDSLKIQKQIRKKQLTQQSRGASRLNEILVEYPDMVFQMQQDGSMMIWGIQVGGF
jgi:hypothetical protein